MATGDIQSTVDWLVDGARSTMQAHQVLAELCERLVGCGIPLWRVAVFVRTLASAYHGPSVHLAAGG
jgi:adenylate cyclase